MANPSDPDDSRGWARQLATLGHVGTMFPVAIGLGFLGGWWIDGRLGTRPWLALLGFAFGVAAALRNLIRSVRDLEESESAAEAPPPPTPLGPTPPFPTSAAPHTPEPPDEPLRETRTDRARGSEGPD